MKHLLHFLVFSLFFFSSCQYSNYRDKPVVMKRYAGNNTYKQVKNKKYKRGERIFIDVPAFDYLMVDDFGKYRFNYELNVFDQRKHKIFHLEKKDILLTIRKAKELKTLKFFYDSRSNQKIGNYTIELTIQDLNFEGFKVFKQKFTLVR